MALSSLPYFDLLLGDAEAGRMLGLDADIAAMLAFEAALAEAQADFGMLSAADAKAILRVIDDFRPDMDKLTEATLKDGVPVPNLVSQLRKAIGAKHGDAVHKGATSQDVVDTALAIKLIPLFALFEERLHAIDNTLAELHQRFGKQPLVGQTRMQAAIEITVGDRVSVWRGSLAHAAAKLETIKRQMLIVSLAGAAGTAEKFGDTIAAVREGVARRLGLFVPDYVPHADRGRIADLASWLSTVTGALGKIGQDAALMAQTNVRQISIAGGGGSSAMPHKQNPVRAEALIALARFNAAQVSALHQALIHEQERSGSAWTLEWLTLPPMLEATAASLTHAQIMLSAVERIGEPD